MDLKIIENDLLPVYENEYGEKLVNARELHEKLLSRQKFTDWIQRRIENYGFIEGDDFFITLGKSTGGRPAKEFYLILDTAKEIAMVENNEQGRAIRKYFIEIEKRYRQQKPHSQLEILQMAVNQLVEQEKRVKEIEQSTNELKKENNELKKENEVLKHRMDTFDRVDTIGDLQQRLNKMIRKYAAENGITFQKAWNDFRDAFNTAYRTNLTLRIQNYKKKHGLKNLTAPQYLSLAGLLEDAIRVADKMLNTNRGLRVVN